MQNPIIFEPQTFFISFSITFVQHSPPPPFLFFSFLGSTMDTPATHPISTSSATPSLPSSSLPPLASSSRRPPRPPLPPFSKPPFPSRFASASPGAPKNNVVHRRARPRSVKEPYIPPHRQRRIDAAVPTPLQPASQPGQKRAWTDMRKRINRIVNMINSDNVALCAKALFRLNLIRARGVFVKTILRHQLASPALSPVFACLIAIIGSRLPQVAELLVARLIAQLKAAYENQDRVLCFATAKFIAHLFNQQVVTSILPLEFLSTCTLDPSDGSVELAVVTLQECTMFLSEKCPRLLEAIYQRLRQVLHDGELSRRVQVMIEDLIAMRRKSLTNDSVLDPRLDLLDEEDIITHLASLDDEEERDLEYDCDNSQYDPDYEQNERAYEAIKRDILGAEADASEVLFRISSSPGNSVASATKGKGSESDGQSSDVVAGTVVTTKFSQDNNEVKDMTEAESKKFKRTAYLTIVSGLTSEEWAHKLIILMKKNPGREYSLCEVVIECCREEKTFLRPFGLLGQRFCLLDSVYVSKFEELFGVHYATIHRFSTRQIRNMACFYAFLFAADALPWSVFQLVRIVEHETTSSSRIFLKNLFHEIAKTLGKARITEQFNDHGSRGNLDGLLPADNLENANYAILFFKAIELEYLAEGLRGKLSTLPNPAQVNADDDDDDNSSTSSSSSSSSLSSSSLSDIGDEGGSSPGGGSNNGGENEHRALSDTTSKRGQDESSIQPSQRPVKIRRRIVQEAVKNDDRKPIGGDDDFSTRSQRKDYYSDEQRSGPHGGSGSRRSDDRFDDDSDGGAIDIDRVRRRLRNKERRRGVRSSSSRGLRDDSRGRGRDARKDRSEYSSSDYDDGKERYESSRRRGREIERKLDYDKDDEHTRRGRKHRVRDKDGERIDEKKGYCDDVGSGEDERERKLDRRSRGRRHDGNGTGGDDMRESRREGRRSRKEYGSSSRRGHERDRDACSNSDGQLSLRSRSRSPERQSKYWSGSVDRYGRSTKRER